MKTILMINDIPYKHIYIENGTQYNPIEELVCINNGKYTFEFWFREYDSNIESYIFKLKNIYKE